MDRDSRPIPRKRRRPALACEECRRRKIKCDQQMPCDQCKLHKSRGRKCTYKSDPRAQHPAKDGLQSWYASSFPSPPDDVNPPQSNRTGTPRSSRAQSPEASVVVQSLSERVRQLEAKLADNGNPPSTMSFAATPSSVPATDSSRMIAVRGMFSKSRYFGQSHWANGIDQV